MVSNFDKEISGWKTKTVKEKCAAILASRRLCPPRTTPGSGQTKWKRNQNEFRKQRNPNQNQSIEQFLSEFNHTECSAIDDDDENDDGRNDEDDETNERSVH